MTLPATIPRVLYNGNGSTTVFSVPFVFWAASDLRVVLRSVEGVETVRTLNTHYSVSGGGGSTGSITMFSAPANGARLLIRSARASAQEVDLPFGGPFPSPSVEESLDKVTRLVQQLEVVISRAVLVEETSNATEQEVAELRLAIQQLYLIKDSLESLAADKDKIVTVADNIGSVNTVSGSIADVNAVSSSIANVNAVYAALANIDTVVSNIGDVNAVGENIANVSAVSVNLAIINVVYDALTAIGTVADNIGDISALVPEVVTITILADNLSGLLDVVSNLQTILDAVDSAQASAIEAAIRATAAGVALVESRTVYDMVAAVANFKGEWTSLTGELNIPASVTHNGQIWVLLEDLADVTVEEPGVSNKWLDIVAHEELTNPHSSTAEAVPDRLVLRDSAGRAQVAAPAADADIARKDTVDNAINALNVSSTQISPGGSFTSGTVYAARVGNIVTLRWDQLGHPNASTITSPSGFLPTVYRPAGTVFTVYTFSADSIHKVSITSSGLLTFDYRTWAGAPFNSTSTNSGCISYPV